MCKKKNPLDNVLPIWHIVTENEQLSSDLHYIFITILLKSFHIC